MNQIRREIDKETVYDLRRLQMLSLYVGYLFCNRGLSCLHLPFCVRGIYMYWNETEKEAY